MGASKKVIIQEGTEGGASQRVVAENAVMIGGDLTEGFVPVVQADLSVEWQAGGDGSGDVTGFGTSTAGHIAVYKDATGKVIQDGGVLSAENIDFAATSTLDATDIQSAIEEVDAKIYAAIPLPAADHTATGLSSTEVVGESVVFSDLLYIKSDGKWWKADADAATSMPGLRMALATASANASCAMLSLGWARDDTWAWTVGGLIYASVTPGALSQTAPTGAGDQVQVVGVAYHADMMWFNPSPVLAEVK